MPTQAVSFKRLMRSYQKSDGRRRIGPWTGTVEDEILCWIPFLRWLDEDGLFDATRDVLFVHSERSPLYAGLGVEVRVADEGDTSPNLPDATVRTFFRRSWKVTARSSRS